MYCCYTVQRVRSCWLSPGRPLLLSVIRLSVECLSRRRKKRVSSYKNEQTRPLKCSRRVTHFDGFGFFEADDPTQIDSFIFRFVCHEWIAVNATSNSSRQHKLIECIAQYGLKSVNLAKHQTVISRPVGLSTVNKPKNNISYVERHKNSIGFREITRLGSW